MFHGPHCCCQDAHCCHGCCPRPPFRPPLLLCDHERRVQQYCCADCLQSRTEGAGWMEVRWCWPRAPPVWRRKSHVQHVEGQWILRALIWILQQQMWVESHDVGYTPPVPNYRNLLQKKFVPKYKTLCRFLDAIITLFPNISLINNTSLHWNMKKQN